MIKQFMKAVTTLFISILLVFTFAASAEAARLTVSPLLIDHTVEQREVITETITITNLEPKRMVTVYASPHEIELGENGEIKTFVDPSMTNRSETVTSWLEITRANIKIMPGESVDVPLTIRINPNAKPGRYHAFIGFADSSTYDGAISQVMTGTAPGVVVRISLDEDRNVFLRLGRFVVDRFVTDTTEEVVHFAIENPGEDPVVPEGEIIIYDSRGNEVGTIPVNEERLTIAPGNQQEFSGTMPVESGYGRHKALLALEYINGDEQTATLHDTTFFYIVPLELLITIFVAILIFSVAIALIIHYRTQPVGYDEGDGSDDVPMFLRMNKVDHSEFDHDINLKQRDDGEHST